jgi:uridylate kinase
MKKTIVISLGGSILIPEKIDYSFLDNFKKVLRKHYNSKKFVVVCGGGIIARKYICALKHENKSKMDLAIAGIRATRMNAMFLMQFFGKEANDYLPKDMKSVKSSLNRNNVVICGALRFQPDATSDSTAAKLANYFSTQFINMTNVKGLYDKDPNKNKDAKFISKISSQDFLKIANSIKYEAGMHFVLDQNAASIIKEHKINTFIIGKDLKNFDNLLSNKNFIGTKVYNENN